MHKLFKLIVSRFRRKPIIIRNLDDLAEFVPEGEEQTCPPQDLRPPVLSPMTNGAATILDSNKGGEILVDETVGPKPDAVKHLKASVHTVGGGWKVSRIRRVKREHPVRDANLGKVHKVLDS